MTIAVPGLARLIIQNLRSRPIRNGLMGLCVIAVVGMQVGAALIDESAKAAIALGIERLGADLVVVPGDSREAYKDNFLNGSPNVFYMDRAIEARLRSMDWVERVSPQVLVATKNEAVCCTYWQMLVIGFNPASDFTVRPWLREHRDLALGSHDVIVGSAVGAEPGKKIKILGDTFQVAGVLERSSVGFDRTIFVPMQTVYELAHKNSIQVDAQRELSSAQISSLHIKLRKGVSVGIAKSQIYYLNNKLSVLTPDDIKKEVRHHLGIVLSQLSSATTFFWPIATLLIGLVFFMATRERRREIGVLRTLGAPRSFVFRLILFESVVLVGTSALVALALTGGAMMLFADYLSMRFSTPLSALGARELLSIAGMGLGLALLTGIFCGVIPALLAASQEPYETMRRGEG